MREFAHLPAAAGDSCSTLAGIAEILFIECLLACGSVRWDDSHIKDSAIFINDLDIAFWIHALQIAPDPKVGIKIRIEIDIIGGHENHTVLPLAQDRG